jgi:lipoprotein-anchoring transpeptidase ErfK/SrfK
LCGREWGKNRGPGVDTFRRFIYIHGTPDSEPMGIPLSHGCVRMRNEDIVDLFDRVVLGTVVSIR